MSHSEHGALRALVRLWAAVGVTAVATGCVETAVTEGVAHFDYSYPPAPERPLPARGAIWPGDAQSGSFLFFDRKARGVGDLVTVRVLDSVSAVGSAATDVEKTADFSAGVTSDVGFQEIISSPIRWLFRLLGVDDPGRDVPSGTPLNVVDATTQDSFEGAGSTSRTGQFSAVLTCRVVQVLPGEVFHIHGRRAMVVNHETQYLTVEGLVRKQDIGIDNVVISDALADARITLDGLGVVDDKQRPGWMTRVLSWIYPF